MSESVTEAFQKLSRIPCAYVDANVYKFAATALPRLFPRKQIIDWGNTTSEHHYYELRYLNPNDRIQDSALRSEVDLIETVADHVKLGRLRAVINLETTVETWGLPKMDSESGRLYGATVDNVPAPIRSNRILCSAGRGFDELQQRFLRRLKNPRLLELQKLTGGYQGEDRYNSNQLLDAFGIWCAEHNGCEFFLTLDRTLINHLRRRKQRQLYTRVVWPSELLSVIQG